MCRRLAKGPEERCLMNCMMSTLQSCGLRRNHTKRHSLCPWDTWSPQREGNHSGLLPSCLLAQMVKNDSPWSSQLTLPFNPFLLAHGSTSAIQPDIPNGIVLGRTWNINVMSVDHLWHLHTDSSFSPTQPLKEIFFPLLQLERWTVIIWREVLRKPEVASVCHLKSLQFRCG